MLENLITKYLLELIYYLDKNRLFIKKVTWQLVNIFGRAWIEQLLH